MAFEFSSRFSWVCHFIIINKLSLYLDTNNIAIQLIRCDANKQIKWERKFIWFFDAFMTKIIFLRFKKCSCNKLCLRKATTTHNDSYMSLQGFSLVVPKENWNNFLLDFSYYFVCLNAVIICRFKTCRPQAKKLFLSYVHILRCSFICWRFVSFSFGFSSVHWQDIFLCITKWHENLLPMAKPLHTICKFHLWTCVCFVFFSGKWNGRELGNRFSVLLWFLYETKAEIPHRIQLHSFQWIVHIFTRPFLSVWSHQRQFITFKCVKNGRILKFFDSFLILRAFFVALIRSLCRWIDRKKKSKWEKMLHLVFYVRHVI